MRDSKLRLLAVAGVIVCLATPTLAAPAKRQATQPTPASPEGHNAIPLPKDLTDNSNPFVSDGSAGDDRGTRYFQEQQNFRDQNPTRSQESDRVIRQFE